MFQRRRQERQEKAEEERKEKNRRRGRSLPVADVATRRTFIHSVVDPSLVEVGKVPDMEEIRKDHPDLAAALEGIYLILDGVVTDTEYLHKEAPQARCNLVENLGLLIKDLKDSLKKVDPDKKTFRLFGKEIPYKQTMIIGVVVVVAKLYLPLVWTLTMALFNRPELWPWIGGGFVGVGVLVSTVFFVWHRRR